MEKRRLGRTGHMSTVVTLGALVVGREDLTRRQVDDAVELAMSHGVNHVDIAPGYGRAMENMAPWMPRIRDRVFLGAKTARRGRDEAWENVRSSMGRMGVDFFDLFQLHGVCTMDDLDAVTAPSGALETLTEMRDQGYARWLGITGHGPDAPRVHLEALRRFDFDTVMFPVGAAIYRDAAYRRDAERLLEECDSRDVGVQALKMVARGGWGDGPRECSTWYDPHREQPEIDDAVRWTLSQPVHTAPNSGEWTLLGKILDAAERFSAPLSREEQESIVAGQRPPRPEPGLAILPAG